MNEERLSDYNVLFVDDEIQVLRAIKRGLHLEKYNKFFATSGEDALKIIEEEEIALIITDMKMPKMDGLSLLKKVNDLNPNIIKVILSGYTNLAQIIATINAINIYKFILKPWDLNTELKPIIIEGLEKYKENIINTNDVVSSNEKNELFKKLVETNQQNYEQLQQDFKNVKQLNKIIMNYSYFLSLQLKEDKVNKLRLKEELSFIEKISNSFVETLPVLKREMTLKEFEQKIITSVEELLNNNNDKSIEISFKMNQSENIKLATNFVHSFWLVKMLLKDVMNISKESAVEIEVSEKEEKNKKVMKFIISINHMPSVYDGIRKNTLYILSSAFTNILKGSFKIDGVDQSVITLKMQYD